MSFLLDTNVVSEWVKPLPNAGVISWLENVDEDQVSLSAITIAELRYGIERMPAGSRKKILADWLEHDLTIRFEGRILSIDQAVADACGRLIAASERLGRKMEMIDALIAATARINRRIIVTRNTSDFEAVTKDLLNPWH
ncbi:MAG TPA: type II toxin-antitoxin system VapC family toxin [Terriglobales bacterium]|nr:type II toxin-antitoxin system VapC family toxin [Terriglobales bacterium]